MNERYNQPTAHRLEPVKGWDSMAHLDFVAPIASSVSISGGAQAGTVMHLNSSGELETGLEPQSVALFLFFKQYDEDTMNAPTTTDGIKITSISMNSWGGYNSEIGNRGYTSDGNFTDMRNGGASNLSSYAASASGYTAYPSRSAHTTYPALCGMELASTEFASTKGTTALSSNPYTPNTFLTSPKAVTAANYSATAYGTEEQQVSGGFLKPGTPYVDPICGIVSKKPQVNTNGYKMLYFWATWLPALGTTAPTNGQSFKATVTSGVTSLGWAS